MADEEYRTRQKLLDGRRAPSVKKSDGSGGGNEGGAPPPFEIGRRRVLLTLAAGIAIAVGGMAVYSLNGHSSETDIGFAIIDDPQQVIEYIHQQNLPPATARIREEQAQKQELVVWKVTQHPGFSGQEGQVFTIENGIDLREYTVSSQGQTFGVFAEKTTPAFNFSAGANPSSRTMTGTWTTPAGRTNYRMQTGNIIVVRMK